MTSKEEITAAEAGRRATLENQGKASGKKAKQNQKRLGVSVQYVASPDAKERRRRATDLLLQVAAKGRKLE